MTGQRRILDSLRKALASLIKETGIVPPKEYILEVSDDLTLKVEEGYPMIMYPIKWYANGPDLRSLRIEPVTYFSRVSINIYSVFLESPIFKVTERILIFTGHHDLKNFRGILLVDPITIFDLYYWKESSEDSSTKYPSLRGSLVLLGRKKGLQFFKVLFSLKKP